MGGEGSLWQGCDMQTYRTTGVVTPEAVAQFLGLRLMNYGRLVTKGGIFRSGEIVGEANYSGFGEVTIRIEAKHTELVAKMKELLS